jgi:hypothetical protein
MREPSNGREAVGRRLRREMRTRTAMSGATRCTCPSTTHIAQTRASVEACTHAIRQALTPGLEQLVTALRDRAGARWLPEDPAEAAVVVVEVVVVAVEEEVVVVVEEAAAVDVVVEDELEITNGGEDQFRRRKKLFDCDD